MSTIKTALGDIQSSEQVEQLLMDHDFDELVEILTLAELISIYNLYCKSEGWVKGIYVVGLLSESKIKATIVEVLMGVIF